MMRNSIIALGMAGVALAGCANLKPPIGGRLGVRLAGRPDSGNRNALVSLGWGRGLSICECDARGREPSGVTPGVMHDPGGGRGRARLPAVSARSDDAVMVAGLRGWAVEGRLMAGDYAEIATDRSPAVVGCAHDRARDLPGRLHRDPKPRHRVVAGDRRCGVL
jgi:hypothetical protein